MTGIERNRLSDSEQLLLSHKLMQFFSTNEDDANRQALNGITMMMINPDVNRFHYMSINNSSQHIVDL